MPYLVTLHEHVWYASNQFTQARLILRLLVFISHPLLITAPDEVCMGVLRSISVILPQLQEPGSIKYCAEYPRASTLCCHSVIPANLSLRSYFFFIEFVYNLGLKWAPREMGKQTKTVCSLNTSWTGFMTLVRVASLVASFPSFCRPVVVVSGVFFRRVCHSGSAVMWYCQLKNVVLSCVTDVSITPPNQ